MIVASSEPDALSIASKSAPNVIFIHFGAGRSAVGLIGALRSNDACRHIPVVVLNHRARIERDKKGLKAVHRDIW